MSTVAARAGVAISTVSRALKTPDKVDPDTRARILRIIDEIGYVPSAAARNLRYGTSRMILIILPEMLSPLVLELLQAIDVTLAVAGYSLIIGNLDRRATTASHIMSLAQGGLAAGIMLVAGEPPTFEGRSVLDAGLPTVSLMVDLSASGVPSVITNDFEAMQALTRRLIFDGHRRFFYVEGPRNSYHEVERAAGVLSAVIEGRLGSDAIIRHPGDFSAESGYAAGVAFLTMKDRPNAVLSCNDEMAIGLSTALERAGINIPKDVVVAGFDGIKFSTFRTPSLTTVRQPLAEIGAKASKTLIGMIGRNISPPIKTVIASELVFAGSTRHS